MSERTMVIPAPVARPDETVEVHNYRIKNRIVFEIGKCIEAEYTLYGQDLSCLSGRWSYTVVLSRRNPRGECIRLYVGDAAIRPLRSNVSEVKA